MAVISPEEYQKLKNKAASIKTEIDKAKGSLAALMTALKRDFNCDSIEEAEKLLESMKVSLKESEETYTVEMKKFKEKYGDLL